jgi:hypothetical protein
MALTLSGQLKLLKNTPGVFYSSPSMALTLSGHLKLLKKTPGVFLFAAIHGAHPIGPPKAVKKNSRCFFIRRHPWRSPYRAT